MKKQSYSDHIRFYTPHHFIFYPLVLILLVASVSFFFKYPQQRLEWAFIVIALFLTAWVAYMMRQHYALTLQNRMVRLEMRLRYFQLTGARLEMLEPQLSFGQIAALRFASDEELPMLIKRVIDEKLPPDEIKKSIVHWVPDMMRV